jgi:hypothetical protein
VSMSKRDYEAFAAIIAERVERVKADRADVIASRDVLSEAMYQTLVAQKQSAFNALDEVARGIADHCKAQRSEFDRARFLAACKVQ